MTRDPRSRLDDPTAERTMDQSTPSASGLTAGREREEIGEGPGVERNRVDDDVVRRRPEDMDTTPRRYEQDTDEDPVMPSDDPSLGTKI